eukprot:TRINITY_DN17947_c0_g1_i1.p1 TRINITY_DN17947_c0_g1~~TRINITY_DN17947_c0_g1_i1.p1  ORF type:complete len:233 (-),score=24.81 TRINITY_DN17947_c0_g1_i1:68-766(-)
MLNSHILFHSNGLSDNDSRLTRAIRNPLRRTRSAPPKVVHSSIASKTRLACSPAQILAAMRGHVDAVVGHPHGLKLLQLVVEHGNSHDLTELIDELSPVLGDLAMDFRSYELLRRIVEVTDTPYQARQFSLALMGKPFDHLISSGAALPILEACVRRFSAHEAAFVFEGACGAAGWLLQSAAGRCLLETCLGFMPLWWRLRLSASIASVRSEVPSNQDYRHLPSLNWPAQVV